MVKCKCFEIYLLIKSLFLQCYKVIQLFKHFLNLQHWYAMLFKSLTSYVNDNMSQKCTFVHYAWILKRCQTLTRYLKKMRVVKDQALKASILFFKQPQ